MSNQDNFNPSLAKCPQCGTEFEDLRVIRIEQVAVMLGVKVGTVRGWMSKGVLPFRLWVRSGWSIIRVVRSADLRAFMDHKFQLPYQNPDSLASRLWGWTQKNGGKGGRTTAGRKAQARNESTE